MAKGSGDNVIYKVEPMEPADADNTATPRPRALDAFHGLVKAAQADAEASASSRPPLVVAGDAKPAESRKPKTQNDVKSTECYFAYDPSQKLDEHAQQLQSNPGPNIAGHQHHTSTIGPPKAPDSVTSNISNGYVHPSRNGNLAAPSTASHVVVPAAHGLLQPSIAANAGANGPGPSKTGYVASNFPASLDDVESSSQDFDWDQWDAVFGQYVPVDDLMGLDSGDAWRFGQE